MAVTRTASTRKTAPRKPQDHQPKNTEQAVADEEIIISFEFEGHALTGYGDNVTGETMEVLSSGDISRFLKDLLGPEQWDQIKTLPIRKLGKLVEAWGKASEELGNS